jgi:hypothetical protein
MVWALAIMCTSLSCDPIPALHGWFDTEEECEHAAMIVSQTWQPTMGLYIVSCVTRMVI